MQKLKNADEVKELVRSRAKLEEIALDYVQDLRQVGVDTYKGKCPFHEEDTPSFGISVEKQLFYCFGCKEGGDVFDFVQGMEAVSFGESLRLVAERAVVDLRPYYAELTPEEKRQQELYRINREVAEEAEDGRQQPEFDEWMDKRRLSYDVVSRYGVGYLHNPPKSEADAEAKRLGLTNEKEWSNSIVLPLRDGSGRVAGFRLRPLGEGRPKSIGPSGNHPVPVPPVYGLWEARSAIRKQGFVVLVEGEVDALQMVGHGFENTCAMLGTKLNAEMLTYLEENGVRQVVVLADNDKAGREFTMRLARTPNTSRVSIKIAGLGHDGDPDEVLLQHGAKAIEAAIDNAAYAFDYWLQLTMSKYDADSATEKVDLMHEVREGIQHLKEHERAMVVGNLSAYIDVDAEQLNDFFLDREQPEPLYNHRAERIVLARMVDDQDFTGDAIVHLRPADFHLARHRTVFETIVRLYRAQEVVNADTVQTHLDNLRAGSSSYLRDMLSDELDTSSAGFLLDDLRDKAIRRDVQKRAREVAARLGDTSADSKTIIQAFSNELAKATVGAGGSVDDAQTVAKGVIQVVHDRIKNPNPIIGLDLGPNWPVLNATVHGLREKKVMVLAAGANVGKSAMAHGIIARVGVELNEPVLCLSFEMDAESVGTRIISHLSGVEMDDIETGMLDAEKLEYVQDAAARLASSPIHITGRGSSFMEAAAIIRNDAIRRGTRLVVVDYIQLMELGDPSASRMSRHEELGKISGGLVKLATELDQHVIVVAQLNRSGAQKSTGQAQEDLGDSYRIAQDAHHVYILRHKSKEEIEADGVEAGDRYGFLDKNRSGRAKVGRSIVADMGTARMREYVSTAVSSGRR